MSISDESRSRRWFLGASAALGVAATAAACGFRDNEPSIHTTLIRDVRLFDGERTTDRTDVLLEADRITHIGSHPDGPHHTVIEGAGMTLLPGLIDAHTHVFDGSLAEALRHGVTTELDMFCPPTILAEQRRLAAQRDDIADLRSAGTLATPPHGHPTQLLGALAASGRPELAKAAGPIDAIDRPDQAREFVAARLAEGSDYLKIVIDDGASHGTQLPTLSPETVAALTEAGHAAGLRVIAHAITAREVEIALDAGVDGLGHVWADVPDERVSRRLAERVRAQNMFVVTTLAYFEAVEQQATPDSVRHGTFENALSTARTLRKAGAALVAGTDATPFAPAHGSGLHHELELLTRIGMSPTDALAAATSAAARHFGLTDRGRIAPGLRADLLLVHGDPTRRIADTAAIAEVWRRGVRQR